VPVSSATITPEIDKFLKIWRETLSTFSNNVFIVAEKSLNSQLSATILNRAGQLSYKIKNSSSAITSN
jgi:hypothetical protein